MDDNELLPIYVVLVIAIIIVGWFAYSSFNDSENLEKETIVLTNSTGEQIKVKAEIADEKDEQEEGLMNRESLCENCGMLFVYEKNVSHGFWMKNTEIPLSIAFISENGTIMEIQQMEPETTDTHKPEEPYRYALEVNQGFFEENGIDAGDEVSIPGDI